MKVCYFQNQLSSNLFLSIYDVLQIRNVKNTSCLFCFVHLPALHNLAKVAYCTLTVWLTSPCCWLLTHRWLQSDGSLAVSGLTVRHTAHMTSVQNNQADNQLFSLSAGGLSAWNEWMFPQGFFSNCAVVESWISNIFQIIAMTQSTSKQIRMALISLLQII